MSQPLISILIVNWNGAEILPDCLKSLRKQNYKNIEIIIIDNNSADQSIEVIKQFKEVKLIKSKINHGFAGGNNEAFKKAKGIHACRCDIVPYLLRFSAFGKNQKIFSLVTERLRISWCHGCGCHKRQRRQEQSETENGARYLQVWP